jgi:hypothetical protein
MGYGATKSANFDAVTDSFLARVRSGYFRGAPGYIFAASDSIGAGYGCHNPRESAWTWHAINALKAASRDGGTFYPAYMKRPLWDITATYGIGQKAFSDVGGTVPFDRPFEGYGVGGSYDGWQSDGGLGGLWAAHASDSNTWNSGDHVWTAGAQKRLWMVPSGWASVTPVRRQVFAFVSAQSASSEPAGLGTAPLGGLVTDGDCVVVRIAYNASYPTRTNSTVYLSRAFYSNAAGDRSFQVLGGVTGATEPTWLRGLDAVVTETGKTTKWKDYGSLHVLSEMDPAVSYDLIYGKKPQTSGADNVSIFGFTVPETGFPVTLNSTDASGTTFGHTLRLAPPGDRLIGRQLYIQHVSGAPGYEGVLAHRYPDGSGLHDLNLSIPGLDLDKILARITGNAQRKDEWTGANFIPADAPVALLMEYGINAYSRSVPIATEKAYLTEFLGAWQDRYSDFTPIWVQLPPTPPGGVPAAGDGPFDYMSELREHAVSLGAAALDCSQVFGGLSAAAAGAIGLHCEDGVHFTDQGATIVGEALVEQLDIPTSPPAIVRSAIHVGDLSAFAPTEYAPGVVFHAGDEGPSVFVQTKDAGDQALDLSADYASVSAVYRRNGQADVTTPASFTTADGVAGIQVPPPPTDVAADAGTIVTVLIRFETPGGETETAPEELRWVVRP